MQMLIGLMLLVFVIVLSGLSAYFAQARGRDPLLWFMVGMVLNVFGLLALFMLPKLNAKSDEPLGDDVDLDDTQDEEGNATDENIFANYASKQWYYTDVEHQQQGPVQYKILKSIFLRGDISRNAYVWFEGMSGWQRIKDVPGLEEAMAYD